MVYARVLSFFLEKVLPLLVAGKNVLIVSHGNTIRALIKYIESIPDDGISNIEMIFGSVLIYDLDETGHMIRKEVRKLDQGKK